MKERIKALRKCEGLNQAEFGARLGIAPNTVSSYEVGTREVSDAMILLICREFRVNETWLRTGDGEMYTGATRAEELGALVDQLLADDPPSFRTALVTTLLRFRPDGPEWAILERIVRQVTEEYTGKQ